MGKLSNLNKYFFTLTAQSLHCLRSHYPERASALDFKHAATLRFCHSNVVFDLFIGTRILHLIALLSSFQNLFWLFMYHWAKICISQFQAWPYPLSGQTSRDFLKERMPTPGHKESAKPWPLGQKNRDKTTPRGNNLQKSSKTKTQDMIWKLWKTVPKC